MVGITGDAMGNSESSEAYSPSSESQLVASAFSAAFKRPVVTKEEYERRRSESQFAQVETLDLKKMADLSYKPATGSFGDVYGESGSKITIFLRSLNGRRIMLSVGEHSYVEEVKYLLGEKEGITVNDDHIVLMYNVRSLPKMILSYFLGLGNRVMENGRRISEYGVRDMDVIEFTGAFWASGPSIPLVLDGSMLHPAFDYDFSDQKDDGTTFMRGGRKYYRPYGWKRFALKVHGRYKNDTWLGEGGYRTHSSPGEWPVSYHGTLGENANGIADKGYLLSKGKKQLYGKGIYSTPSIDVAADYAQVFEHNNTSYQVVFQNRVSTKGLRENSTTHGAYWVQPDEKLIRPYGLCIREV